MEIGLFESVVITSAVPVAVGDVSRVGRARVRGERRALGGEALARRGGEGGGGARQAGAAVSGRRQSRASRVPRCAGGWSCDARRSGCALCACRARARSVRRCGRLACEAMLRSALTGGMVGLPPPPHARLSLFDSCHRKIRLIGGGPVAFLGGLVAKARRKEREGEGGGDPKLYLQEALLERKLPELDLRQLVELPHGLDYNEWLASHTLALFEHVNLLYGTVSEFCSAASCGDMAGPGGRAYAWYDERGKKSRVAAPQYVDYVMTYTQKTINDETVFPTKYANEFPAQFESVVRRVVRLLFHVVAHMYAAHFRELALLRLHAHLHLTFAHLTALDRRYALLDAKETEVLRDLEVALRLTEPAGGAAAGGAGGAAADGAEDASPRRRSPVVTQPLASA